MSLPALLLLAVGLPIALCAIGVLVVRHLLVTSARQAALAERQAGAARFRSLFEENPDAVVELDARGRIQQANAMVARLLGVDDCATLLGQPFDVWLEPADRADGRVRFTRALDGEPQAFELRVRRADGETRILTFRVVPIRDASEPVRGIFAIAHDVTAERRQATVFASVADAVLILDLERRILDANPAAEQKFGWSRTELLGDTPDRIYPAEGRAERIAPAHAAALADGWWNGEMPFVRKDGTTGVMDVRVVLQRDASSQPTGFIVVHRNITAQRQLEAQLRQAHKLEAVGRLAGGIAHDFNNILTAVVGSSTFLLRTLPAEDGRRQFAETIRDAADRATVLTRQLLAFSQRQMLRPEAEDLNTIISETSAMLDRVLGEDVVLLTELAPTLAPVLVDRAQVEQVLLTLAVNARDAMPRGGTLHITTDAVRVQEGDAPVMHGRPIAAGDYACLTVRDSGTGIPDEDQPHLFEPFFTTKGHERDGMGLATVYGIVAQLAGAITVESTLGSGTAFRLYFPYARTRARASTMRTAAPQSASDEFILVVEDSAPVRDVLTRVLRDAGYPVIEARSGAEALAVLEARRAAVSLVVSDVMMPGMTGIELAARVRAMQPDVAVLFVTGYAEELVKRRTAGTLDAPVLFKPFDPDQLLRVVADLLEPDPPLDRDVA